MELARELAKEFAAVTSDLDRNPKRETLAYGVVKKEGDDTFVKLDGTDVLTPVSFSMDADENDRVLIMLKEHSATVIGNITSPASARTATSYMKLTGKGLVVGNLGNGGDPVGTYVLINGDGYYIMNSDGSNPLASFTSDKIEFGDGKGVFTSDSISLANGLLVIDENAVSFQNGKTVFGKDRIVIGISYTDSDTHSVITGPAAVFTSTEISLADGAATITPTSLTFGASSKDYYGNVTNGPKAVFSVDGITLGTAGQSQAKFTISEISLGDGAAVISPTSITLGTYGKCQATFSTSGISLADGSSTFTPSAITLGTKTTSSYGTTTYGPKAVFSTNKISLADGELEITPSSITLRAKTGVNYYNNPIYGPSAEFSATGITLTWDETKYSYGTSYITTHTTSFGTSEVSLMDGEAVLSANSLSLGKSEEATISLCGGNGSIEMSGDILVIKGQNAVGFQNEYKIYDYYSGYQIYKSEVVCRNDSSQNAQIGIQTFDPDGAVSSVIVDINKGLTFNATGASAGISFYTGDKDDIITANGYEILQSNRLVYAGRIESSTSIAAGKMKNLEAVANVPPGYRLVGIRQASCNKPNFCVLSRFVTNPTTNVVKITYKNISDEAVTVSVGLEWFALRTSIEYEAEKITSVTWTDSETE